MIIFLVVSMTQFLVWWLNKGRIVHSFHFYFLYDQSSIYILLVLWLLVAYLFYNVAIQTIPQGLDFHRILVQHFLDILPNGYDLELCIIRITNSLVKVQMKFMRFCFALWVHDTSTSTHYLGKISISQYPSGTIIQICMPA